MSATAQHLKDEEAQAPAPGKSEGEAREERLLEAVRDNPELLEFIRDSAEEIIQLEKDRKRINEKMASIREDVVAEGINRHAFAAAIARFKLEETDRHEREISYQVCLTALDVKHEQLDLLAGSGKNTH